ncbi:MAG: long-chain fatty acid--CoA ligase [Chlorobium sp.]|jgi:long-chain acyl-CoA synthetase|uniref:long-chain-fatty-acid--CoA ligase n=1 Tax=Chlorobium sp. TaxID=1095 RepID=UPI001D7AD59C|nr:long-chain fatty acid--CoA ligase [Chlorobium sp.]MBN1278522.1 long-chain fatty acid--CoA ligase [Chlorobiaceae bacterium]MCF8215572.1 long-chain fatty acid--CoA ligase [Chlorobium sp.]MCF8270374.1 long-chain fatty acid--CoA ligase [Chlorobium sp.]MCF8286743.1 long-chain fatty acid--CoA ligase [Chlorobium sp.]MCF8290265.1 long-chain fatty acid--CoA ligase [Chlorobium sp.]
MTTAKPWLRHYDKGVPHSLEPYPEHTLVDIVRRTASEQPDHPVLYFKGRVLSYGLVERESSSLAESLKELGVAVGDRVALIMPNSPQMIISELAVWKTGAIVVPLNPLYTETELAYALNECGAETVIVLSAFYGKISDAKSDTRLRRVIVTSIKEYLPPLKQLLFTLLKEKKDGHRIELLKGDFLFQDLVRRYDAAEARPMPVSSDAPALFLFSGGTTGNPKCAVSTHRSLVVSGMQIASWFSVILDRGTDSIILNMPLFHVYGQAGILPAALTGGFPIVLVPNPRDLDDLLHAIRTLRPAVLPGVPTLFTALLNHPAVRKQRGVMQSIKLCVSGAAPLMQETKRSFEELTGGRIIDAYSLTETTLASTFTPILGTYKPGSVGIPVSDVEVRIVDQECGMEELGPNEVGEVLMRAPQLMKEYWQNPEETAIVLRGGWLYTGDLGYLDEDGYLFIVDRKKDVIKPGGFQVWPRDVEEVIASHPAVQEVSVAGVPDPYKVEAVKAWVVLRDGHSLTAEALCEFCRQDLAAYKIPRHVEFIQALPKSTVGKVLRRKLVEEHCLKAGSAGT